MADAFVAVGADIIVVLKLLLFCKLAQEINVAMGVLVCRKNIVVRQDDNFPGIPHFCVSAKFLLENIKGWWTADIVGKEDVDIQPDAFTSVDKFSVCGF